MISLKSDTLTVLSKRIVISNKFKPTEFDILILIQQTYEKSKTFQVIFRELINLDATMCLGKPFNPTQLVSCISILLFQVLFTEFNNSGGNNEP